MNSCIFCQIARREIPKEFTYEDEEIVVFPDINPVRPVHLLIMPKKHIADFLDPAGDLLWKKLRTVAQKMIREQKLENRGYRILINGGGAQIIDHLHLHLMGPMGEKVKF